MGRTRNAARNIKWGLVYKFSTLAVSFIARTVMIYTLGAEYLGLNSLFSSVLRILSLADLGFGTAITYSMYKPVAENDEEMVCALLGLYRKIYRIVGTVILGVGLLLFPFIPHLIAGSVPSGINVRVLFLIYLLDTVSTYFFFAYRASVLTAHQRNDIPSVVSMVTNLTKNLIQIVILLTIRNYYCFVLVIPAISIITNLITAYLARRYYPQYECRGAVDQETQRQIGRKTRALLGVKITGLIYNSVDSVVISSFLGLVVLAKYNNYYYVMDALIAVIAVIFNSIQSTVGNSIVLETPEKNYRDYMNLSYINAWLIGWCTVCLYCLYQPFIRLWAGESLMFEKRMVVWFCVYFYVYQLKIVQSTYKDAAGLWREDMWRSYGANLFNLIANLILVQVIGVEGILLSTILSLLVITYPWQTWMIHRKLFCCSMKPYVIRLLVYTAATVTACLITEMICGLVTLKGPGELILRGLICCVVPNCLFLLFSLKTKEFAEMRKTVRKVLLKL